VLSNRSCRRQRSCTTFFLQPGERCPQHTAFACALTKSDFAQWDRKLSENARVAEETALSLTAAVRHNLNKIRLQNPQLFYEVNAHHGASRNLGRAVTTGTVDW
jgi:hypothetical protein